MNIYYKFIVHCEKVKPTLIEKLTFQTKKQVEIWAPGIINGFRDKINTEVFRIISIEETEEKMEVFGR